jgi:hypothetical protein
MGIGITNNSSLSFFSSFAGNAGEGWNQTVWEDLVLRLLSETLKMANDDEWTVALGNQYAQQLELYNNDPEMKVNPPLFCFSSSNRILIGFLLLLFLRLFFNRELR